MIFLDWRIILKNRCEIQNASSYDLAFFINKMGSSDFKRYIAGYLTLEQHDGESFTNHAANIDFISFLSFSLMVIFPLTIMILPS